MAIVDTVGGYVPLYRIERATVAEQHGGSASGETAVPARDETLVSMASEAAGIALDRASRPAGDLGAVFVASVTDPLAEHGLAAHVAYRHGAAGDLRTGDFRATPRAATDAFVAGLRHVEATGVPALVAGVDALPVDPGHDDEPYSGAGAGAVVLASQGDGDDSGDGDGGSTATIHGVGQETTAFVERHREHGEAAESGDRRFEGEAGFGAAMPEAAQRALGTAPAMPEAAVVAAPDQRLAANAVSELPGEVAHVSTFESVGYAGCGSFFLDLAHLCEREAAGTTALAGCYGAGGADAVALTVDDGAPAADAERAVAAQVNAKEYVTYAGHLEHRERPEYEGVSVE